MHLYIMLSIAGQNKGMQLIEQLNLPYGKRGMIERIKRITHGET